MSSKLSLALILLIALAGLTQTPVLGFGGAGIPACHESQPISPALRQEILQAREAVWRAWFANDREKLDWMIPAGTVAINAGAEEWEGREQVLAGSRAFAEGHGRLVRLEFPRTEVQLFGDVAILYTRYLFETETSGELSVTAGRGTEIFVRRNARWVNPGWHTDSGK